MNAYKRMKTNALHDEDDDDEDEEDDYEDED